MAQAAQLAEHNSNLAHAIEECCKQSSALGAEAASYAERAKAIDENNHDVEAELVQLRVAVVCLWAPTLKVYACLADPPSA